MQEAERVSLEQIRAFLEGSAEVRFYGERGEEIYQWTEQVLRTHGYGEQTRAAKGLLRQFVGKLTGLSRAQVTRSIAR